MAGFVFFIIQLIAMGLAYWLIKKFRKKDVVFLIPIMHQFKGFFALAITIWISLAVIGHAADLVGRVYSIGAFIIFLGLSTSLTHQLFVVSDLLSPYTNENEKGKDDKYDSEDQQR